MSMNLHFRTSLAGAALAIALGALPAAADSVIGAGAPIAAAVMAKHYSTGLIPTPPAVLAKIPTVPEYRGFVPVAVDLSDHFPRIFDQASQGACVAFSTSEVRAYYGQMLEGKDISKDENVPSQAFVYNAVHQPGTDKSPCGAGSSAVDALELFKHGVKSLAAVPFDGRDDASACPTLSKAEIDQGTEFKIAGYERPKTWDDVKAEIAKGNPVIVGADLDSGFSALHGPAGAGVWTSGPIDPNAPYEGHEFVLVGYDDQQQTFKFINSWNDEWGDNGFGRMTYATAANRVDEAFVMRMPGDPDITLASTDFRADVPNVLGPTLQTQPSTGAAATRGNFDVGGLWCGKVGVATGSDGKEVATGFVSSDAELDKVKAAVDPGADLSGIKVIPWPLCETQLTLGAALNGADAPGAKIAAASDGGHSLTLTAPSGAGFVYAVTFNADGTVKAASDVKPVAGPGALTLSASAGKDAQTLLVVASDKALFDGIEDGESVRTFLSQLRDGVLHSGAGHISASLVTALSP